MKKIEFWVPGINLSDISAEKIRAFAAKHNDQYAINCADDPAHPDHVKGLQYAFIRVVRAETGISFDLLETEDGNYAVFLPDAWHPISFDRLYTAISTYANEIGISGNIFQNVMTSVMYE